MRRLKIAGHVRGLSGYDHHTREFVRALLRLGSDIELRHLSGWSPELPPQRRETWFDRLDCPVAAKTMLQFVMPPLAAAQPGLKNVNYTMFEADRIPSPWVKVSAAMDMTILPTESSRLAWVASGADPAKLAVVPLAVDGERFAAGALPLALCVEGRPVAEFATRILNVTDLSPRKNYLGLVRAWLDATNRSDDAVLILKNNAYQDALWPIFRAELAEVEAAAGKTFAQAAPLLVLGTPLDAAKMPSLYASASHYWSMSRGEGWDMPMMEAIASGLTPIAPRHTAYPSYLDANMAHWIEAPMVPATIDTRIRAGDRIWFEGLNWWEPSHEAAVETILAIVAGTAPRTCSARDHIVATYSWINAARRLLEILP